MSNGVDFAKVEVLRRRMLLSKNQLATLLGVSRLGYHNWVSGKSLIRAKNAARVKRVLRRLLNILMEEEWPSPAMIEADSDVRFAKLVELMDAKEEAEKEKEEA